MLQRMEASTGLQVTAQTCGTDKSFPEFHSGGCGGGSLILLIFITQETSSSR